MRIVVYPHDLGVGGSQLNAIELAAAVRDLGHDVLVFGRPGVLVHRVEELGLEFVEAPPPGKRPSPSAARALRALVAQRGVDVVHGYEWPPTLDAVLAFPGGRTAVVSTVMSMSVPPFIPRSVDLVVGTEQIAAAERQRGRDRVRVIEPPVDLVHNHPGAGGDVADFRRQHGLEERATTVVSVARFARELKLEGTLTAIAVIGELARTQAVQLVLVGDGPARDDVARAAAAANAIAGRRAVVLTGQLNDPRPAYAAADIALGMGGSALRALAFGAPLVVQGEQGFWRTLEPTTLDEFLWTGWYGVGADADGGAGALRRELAPLLADAGRRAALGAYGLDVVQRFSLARAAERQAHIYAAAVAAPAPHARASETVAYARYARYYGAKRIRRALGRESTDDFNAKPVAAAGPAR